MTSGSDFHYRFLSPTGSALNDTYASNGAGGDIFVTTPDLALTGTYSLVVTGNGNDTGTYNFRVLDQAAAPTVSLTPGALTTITGTLATGLTTDLYTFSGTAGEVVTLQGISDAHTYGSYTYLFSPNDAQITYNYNNNSGNYTSATLPAAGTYLIAVRGESSANTTDAYAFTITANINPTDSLTLGATVSGTIANAGDSHTYTFQGTAGQHLYFDGLPVNTSGNFLYQFYDPTGTRINYGYDSYGSGGDFFASSPDLPLNGTYTLTVTGSGNTTGSYGFRLLDQASAATVSLTAGVATTITGTLATGFTTDLYTFSGTTGEIVTLQGISDAVSSGAIVYLYDPLNNNLTSIYPEGNGNYATATLPADGTYLLAVRGQSASNTNDAYAFRVIANATPTDSLTLGTTYSGTIANAGDSHTYTFQGTAGQNLYFDGLPYSTSGDVLYQFYDPLGTRINYNYASGNSGGDFFASSPVLPVTGTYSLVVTDTGGSTGSYSFRLLDQAAAPTVTLNAGTTTTIGGTLATGLSTDLYTFTGAAGETVTLSGLQDGHTNGAYVYLYDPISNQLTSLNIDSSSSHVTAVLPGPGTYLLTVAGQSPGNSNDTYTFTALQTTTTPSTTTATSLTLGTTVTGSIAASGTITYTFQGTAGQHLYFDSLGSSYSYTLATLYDPTNHQIESNYVSNDSFTSQPALSQTGTYTLVISSGVAGSYSFRLLDQAAAPTVSLTTGTPTTITGTLSTGLTTDLYTFSGTAGEVVTLQGISDAHSSGALVYLYNPINSSPTDIYPEGSGYYATVTLPAAGTYLIAVQGQTGNNTNDAYAFTITANINPTDSLTLGATVSGTIANAGDSHTYTFQGTAGQHLYFDGLPVNTSGNFLYQFYDPTGTRINYGYDSYGSGGDFFASSPDLPLTGTYTLTVTGSGNTTGSYGFRLLDQASAATVSLTAGVATTITGTLATGFTTDLYTFSGTTGEIVTLQGISDAVSSGAIVYLYDPLNNNLTSIYPEGNGNYATATLPADGTYLLAVRGQSASNTNDAYAFRVIANVSPTTSLTLGSSVTGTIASIGDTHTYTFQGTAGQHLYFDGLPYNTSGNFLYQFYDPTGARIDYSYASYYGSGGDFFASAPDLPLNGTYSLVVTDTGGSTGSYSFRLLDQASAATVSLTAGAATTITGTLATGLTTDLYTFSGTSGEVVTLQGISDAVANGALVYLYDPLNNTLTDIYPDGNGNYATATLPAAGTYLLAVQGRSNNNTADAYAFTVIANATPTTDLSAGATVTGTLANTGDTHTYTLQGTAGQHLYFDGLPYTTAGSFVYQFYDPLGTRINYSYTYYNNSGGDFFASTPALPQTGTYTLVVTGNGASTGTYSFRLLDETAAPSISLTAGTPTTITGTLATGQTTDLYTFSGTAGEVVTLQGISDAHPSGSTVYLYDLDRNSLTSIYPEGSGSYNTATLPATGTYLIAVQGNSSANVNNGYAFTITQNIDPTDSLVLGSTVSGTIANAGDSHTYTFAGLPGQTLYFNGLSQVNYLRAVLYAPDGSSQLFGQYTQYNVTPFNLSEIGTYQLVVSGYSTIDTGAYAFRLLDESAQPEILVNTTEALLTVSLSAPSTQQITVNYATADDSATLAENDYRPASGLLLFFPGQTSITLPIQVINGAPSEATEDFFVNLTNPTNATIADSQGMVTITGAVANSVKGEVYNDTNGNGSLDAGETGLAGITLNLVNGSNVTVTTAVTGTDGTYTFSNITPGSYTVSETLPGGSILTSPTGGNYLVNLSGSSNLTGENFGNFQTFKVSGQVYSDLNDNGALDAGEPGLSGWAIKLVQSGTGTTLSTTTDANGNYSFSGVGPVRTPSARSCRAATSRPHPTGAARSASTPPAARTSRARTSATSRSPRSAARSSPTVTATVRSIRASPGSRVG